MDDPGASQSKGGDQMQQGIADLQARDVAGFQAEFPQVVRHPPDGGFHLGKRQRDFAVYGGDGVRHRQGSSGEQIGYIHLRIPVCAISVLPDRRTRTVVFVRPTPACR